MKVDTLDPDWLTPFEEVSLYVRQTFLGGKLAMNLLDACPKHKAMMSGVLTSAHLRSVPISRREFQRWRLLLAVNPQSACTSGQPVGS